jgi:hypothetical protein
MKVQVKAIREHVRGKIYQVTADGKGVSILFTFHSLERTARWRLTGRKVLQALLFPEEVVRGHRNRYIAHRRSRGHVVRAVYEYEGNMPAVITVYYPAAGRYFRGGGIYEDKILS